ncbi:unnamed protein product [Heterobilharzia americana]|nr:unnamed protein product [Heterobilharzia americana]
MFHIKSIQLSDLSQVYEFTLCLFRHHYGTEVKCLMGLDEFERIFKIDFLKGFLLMHTPDNSIKEITQKNTTTIPIGCMIYFTNISPLHGGFGLILDQFYIVPEFRCQGLGHMMMSRLCKEVITLNGNYIKLSYQDCIGLERFYTNLGFINHTRQSPGLHIFELYGKSTVTDFLRNYSQVEDEDGQQEQQSTIMILPCTDYKFPKAQVVTVLSYANTCDKNTLQIIQRKCSIEETCNHKGMCIYVEQCCVCCWLGPMLNFSDFVGDLSILSKRYIRSRVQLWQQLVPELCGVIWEVPCGENSYRYKSNISKLIHSLDMSYLNDITLAKQLIQLNVSDDTTHEGWNINYLNKENIIKLSNQLVSDIN